MDYSRDPKVVNLIKKLEGFSAKAYVDATGHSIGYGHFIRPDEKYLLQKSITQEEAETLLYEDIKSHQEPWIGSLKKGSPETVAALTSFAYNVGAHSPVLKKAIKLINEGQTEAGAEVLQAYHKARVGPNNELVPVAALKRRRQMEKDLIMSGGDDNITIDEAYSDSRTWGEAISEWWKGTKERHPTAMDDMSLILNENKRILKELSTLTGGMGADLAWEQRLRQEGSPQWQARR
jgi:GH24 family phage-related lysozyme (muramidase)